MPTYEYECEKCKQSFETEQRVVDPPVETCPREECGGRAKRLIAGSTTFVLNGGRWAKDGYK